MASCLRPMEIRNKKTNKLVRVPCSKCPTCLARRASAWSFRLMQEEKVSTSAYFVTLTYDTDNVPITKNGFMSLDKRHVQLFFKRLRKAHEHDGLKYYLAGEYGTKSWRPHYHVILFNADLRLIIGDSFANLVNRGVMPLDGKANFPCSYWKLGHLTVGTVTAASVGYTLKYICKTSRIPLHRNDDRLPEFALMSKGLGLNYLTPAMQAWHKADLEERMYCNLTDGKKCSMPRYYKDKLYNEDERKRISEVLQEKGWLERAKEIELAETDPLYSRNKRAAIDAAFTRLEYQNSQSSKI